MSFDKLTFFSPSSSCQRLNSARYSLACKACTSLVFLQPRTSTVWCNLRAQNRACRQCRSLPGAPSSSGCGTVPPCGAREPCGAASYSRKACRWTLPCLKCASLQRSSLFFLQHACLCCVLDAAEDGNLAVITASLEVGQSRLKQQRLNNKDEKTLCNHS